MLLFFAHFVTDSIMFYSDYVIHYYHAYLSLFSISHFVALSFRFLYAAANKKSHHVFVFVYLTAFVVSCIFYTFHVDRTEIYWPKTTQFLNVYPKWKNKSIASYN